MLSLILAQRRPSGLLISDRAALRELTDRHLVLLEQAGVIDARLRDAALATILEFRPGAVPAPHGSFAETKGVDAVRAELLSLLGVPGTYELDRLDARVTTTLDAPTQTAVRRVLADLRDPARARRHAARAAPARARRPVEGRLLVLALRARGRRERAARAGRHARSALQREPRHEARPRLDREAAHARPLPLARLEPVGALARAARRASCARSRRTARIAIGAFVLETLRARPQITLAELLDAALDRRFSASPATLFFTGGGLHRFANFDEADDARVMTLRTAFRHSVNLPFVRLMREIVDHTLFGPDGFAGRVLDDPHDPARAAYLERFVAWEGRLLLDRFLAKHAQAHAGAAQRRAARGPARDAAQARRWCSARSTRTRISTRCARC